MALYDVEYLKTIALIEGDCLRYCIDDDADTTYAIRHFIGGIKRKPQERCALAR